MRIGFLAQPFDRLDPPVQGGSLAIWIYRIARVCAQRGHDSIVFANHGSAFRAGVAQSENVRYIYTPTVLNRLQNRLALFRNGHLAIPRFASPWQDRGYAREVGRRSRRMECEVVHIMNYSQFVPVIRALNPGCKICLHMQCEWLTQIDPATIESRLEAADLIIGCSEYITRTVAEGYPRFAKRCVTVPNAAELAEDAVPAPEPFHVLFVGRVSPEKGVHDLILAFHDVLKRFPDARLHIVGGIGSAPLELLVGLSKEPQVMALRRFYEGGSAGGKDPYLVQLEQYAGPELGKRILFEGRVDHSRTQAFYKRAAVLVNPSLSESFGMSLVEAMMHRVPVVATRVGGMPYIVNHGQTGLLAEPANPKGLAGAICEILEDRERARRMGEAGRKRAVERFSWQKSADLLLEHFHGLLQSAGQPCN